MVIAKPITVEDLARVPEDERCCQSPSFIGHGADNRNGSVRREPTVVQCHDHAGKLRAQHG